MVRNRSRSRSRSASPTRHSRRREGEGRSRSDSTEQSMLKEAWRPVKEDPRDFEHWTRLLKTIERVDDARESREAYDRFFQYWPYCYGYWIKYAEAEKQHRHWEKALDVYERGLEAIPLSVDLWLSYIAYIKEIAQGQSRSRKTIEKIRSVYNRAVEACGLDFRSDKLWMEYIDWLQSVGEVKEAADIYDVLLLTPTAQYAAHFDRYKAFVGSHEPDKILSEEEYNAVTDIVYGRIRDQLEGPMYFVEEYEVENEEEFTGAPGNEPPKKVIRDRKHVDVALSAFREEIIERRQKRFRENEKEVGLRWNYESGIKRPYFHVKPLEREQLNNWFAYLDFELKQKKKQRIECLFGRCLIACALYEELWIKYGAYLEATKDEAGAQRVYKQAVEVHCSRKPGIYLVYSAFEEARGNSPLALSLLTDFDRRHPNYTAIQLRIISIERRRLISEGSSDFSSLVKRYEKYITDASFSRKLSSFWSLKLARFYAKVAHDKRMAKKVIKAAVARDKDNLQLYTQLVDLAYSSTHSKDSDVIAALDFAIESPDLSLEERYQFSVRKTEYLEELATDPSLLNQNLTRHLAMERALDTPAATIFHGKRGAPMNKERDIVDVKKIKLEEESTSPMTEPTEAVGTTPTIAGDGYPTTAPTTMVQQSSISAVMMGASANGNQAQPAFY